MIIKIIYPITLFGSFFMYKRIEEESGLDLIDLVPSELARFKLTDVHITQPNLSISLSSGHYLKVFLSKKDQMIWIVQGQPNNEPDLQTVSYKSQPTEIKLHFNDNLTKPLILTTDRLSALGLT